MLYANSRMYHLPAQLQIAAELEHFKDFAPRRPASRSGTTQAGGGPESELLHQNQAFFDQNRGKINENRWKSTISLGNFEPTYLRDQEELAGEI